MKAFFKKFFFNVVLMITTWTFSIAQVSIIAPVLDAENGDIISADIRTTNFDEIVAMQFSMHWDFTVLKLTEINNFSLPDLSINNFGTTSGSSGIATIAWIDETLEGITLADTATLFTLQFEVIGDGDIAPIVFTDSPTLIEIGNADDQILEVTLVHGVVNVGDITSSTKNTTQKDFYLGQNYPNPFKESTFIPFSLTHSNNINVEIYNSYGQLVHQQQNFFLTGKHNLKVDSSLLPSAGIYTIKLFTSNFLATKQLIFLN